MRFLRQSWCLYAPLDSLEIPLSVFAVTSVDLLDGPEYFLVVLHVFAESLTSAVAAPTFVIVFPQKAWLRVSVFIFYRKSALSSFP